MFGIVCKLTKKKKEHEQILFVRGTSMIELADDQKNRETLVQIFGNENSQEDIYVLILLTPIAQEQKKTNILVTFTQGLIKT